MNFLNIDYLKTGNTSQGKAYKALEKLNIFNLLKDFNPVLCGTFPLAINIDTSDLDIICNVENVSDFKLLIIRLFGQKTSFEVKKIKVDGLDSLICNFIFHSFPIEIFAQNKPVTKQLAYLHMIKENEILSQKDEEFKERIIQLKLEGYKTEPAFAKALEIKGDPYRELLNFEL